MPNSKRPRVYAASLVVGLLLLPTIAFAFSGSGGDTPVATASPVIAVPIAELITLESTAQLDAGDLAAACGADGSSLVEKEGTQTITPIEQAALDALRPICAANSLALADYTPESDDAVIAAGRPGTQPTQRTPAPTNPPAAGDDDTTTTEAPTTTQPRTTTTDDHDDDGDHEDDDDRDDDGDHEDDDEHEDDGATATTTGETQWVLGTYTSQGGTAGIEFSTDVARVAFTSPNPGYETEVEHEDDGVILIFFKGDDHDSLIRVSFDGAWKVTVTEAEDF